MSEVILRLTDGLKFRAGPDEWCIEPLRLRSGTWVAFLPHKKNPIVDPSGHLARTLFSLNPPIEGTVEIFDKDVYGIDYRDIQRLRARMGFVQGFGGLLSNRTIRDNVGLPASVHGNFSYEEEKVLLDETLESFHLRAVENLQPHEVDGYTRWRVCLARALIMKPQLVVLEGLGDWEVDRGRGVAWARLWEYQKKGDNAIVVCMSRPHPEFLDWFKERAGVAVSFTDAAKPAKQGAIET